MPKPTHHILVCQSFRVNGDPKGVCHKKTNGFIQYMEEEILDRGLDVLISTTGCMKLCDNGPVVIVHPENWWFGNVDSEEAIDAILDGLEEGEAPSEYLIYDN